MRQKPKELSRKYFGSHKIHFLWHDPKHHVRVSTRNSYSQLAVKKKLCRADLYLTFFRAIIDYAVDSVNFISTLFLNFFSWSLRYVYSYRFFGELKTIYTPVVYCAVYRF